VATGSAGFRRLVPAVPRKGQARPPDCSGRHVTVFPRAVGRIRGFRSPVAQLAERPAVNRMVLVRVQSGERVGLGPARYSRHRELARASQAELLPYPGSGRYPAPMVL
jgi:hypothetical protein